MQLTFQHNGNAYKCDTDRRHSLAVTLDFNGKQPNFFETDKATSKPLKLGDFTASTRTGGSCNVDCLAMIPHCNGTHTETVGHIVDDDVWLADVAIQPLMLASLISVATTTVESNTTDSYLPKLAASDQIISLASIESALKAAEVDRVKPQALILRTLPNSTAKKSITYDSETGASFFSIEAMQAIIEAGIEHLLVDIPSIDKMQDDGLLTNHHSYWNVPAGTHKLTPESVTNKTVTEMIYVEEEIQDGVYLLNLQAPAFASDAAPSRPVIFELV